MAKQTYILPAMLMLASGPAAAANTVPQMDPSSFPNQLFWLAITFVALYLVVSRSVVPTVSSVLSAREATIADAIAKAEAFKAHAEQTKGDFEAGSSDARAKAAELLGAAQAEAASKQADAMAKLNAELDTRTAKAQQQLAKAVEAAKADLDDAAGELARAMAGKLLGAEVDAAQVKAARKSAA